MSEVQPIEKRKVVSYNSLFLNSETLFIEYMDIFKAPLFMFLDSIRSNEYLNTYFDFSEISELSLIDLFKWYLNRKEQIILLNFPCEETFIKEKFNGDISEFVLWCLNVQYSVIEENEFMYKTNTDLTFCNIFGKLLELGTIKNIYIFTDFKSDNIAKDLSDRFNDDRIKFVYGFLPTVIENEKITSDTTFILSDITKIQLLKQADVLNRSSVIIAEPFKYNYRDDECRINLQFYLENDLFKINWFNNIDYK